MKDLKYGVCSTCGKEKRLTDKRALIATHVVRGEKCAGTGSHPVGEIRVATQEPPETDPQPSLTPDPEDGQYDFEWGVLGAMVALALGGVWIAVAAFTDEHPVIGSVFALASLFMVWVSVDYYRPSRFTPEQLRAHLAREAETKAKNSAEKAASLAKELGPFPPGQTPKAGNVLFLRLNEKRSRGLSGGPSVDLTCGRCGYDYRVPRSLVHEYRSEMLPGASLRRFNNPGVAFRQDQAQLNLRCPACGSVDPGVWIQV